MNTFGRRDQRIVIVNFYWQDCLTLGYTTQFNLHYVHDAATFHFDANNFLVRPAPVVVFALGSAHVREDKRTGDLADPA